MTTALTHHGRVDQLGVALVDLVVQLQMHDSAHALSRAAVRAAVDLLQQESGAIRLERRGDRLTCAGNTLLRTTLQATPLLRLLAERGIDALELAPSAEDDEILRFFALLMDPGESAAFAPTNLQPALARLGIHNVGVLVRDGRDAEDGETDAGLTSYQALSGFLQDNHVNAYRGDEIELDQATSVVDRTMALMGRAPSELLALAMHDDIDNFTVGHSVRVTLLALHVARAAGASDRQLTQAGTAALLHDIGKSRIPQDVLFKTGALDDDERRVMAEHARLGGEILLEQDGVDPIAVGAAFCHHMGPGGSGYPTPALPFEPSGVSKLVRVCDVFEALTAARPYKAPMTPVEAYVIMHRMRDGFDPRWLRFFVRALGLYPIGTRVELDRGEQALVVGTGPSLRQPSIRLLTAEGGGALPADAPTDLIVGEPHEGHVSAIAAVIGADRRVPVDELQNCGEHTDTEPHATCCGTPSQ